MTDRFLGAPAHRRQTALRLLLSHLRPHRRTLAAGGVLTLLGAAAGLAQPLLAKEVVDRLGAHRSPAGPVALLAVALVAGAVLAAVGGYLLGRAGESAVFSARHRLVSRLLRLPDNTLRVAVQGVERIQIEEIIQTEPYLRARVRVLIDADTRRAELCRVSP